MQSEQQQRIMGYFIEEAKDHLNTIEQGLLNLQGTIEDSDLVHELFRAAHSVKGGAAMLGLDSIQQTSHRMEDYFKVLKECPIQVDQKLESLFLRVFDTLQELLEQLQGPFGLTEDKASQIMGEVEPVLGQLNDHLQSLVDQSGSSPPAEVDLRSQPISTVPAAAPTAGTVEDSALRLYFQSDVPAQLRTMLQLLKQPETYETRQQLQQVCSELIQAGESFDLPPSWNQLIATAQRAIANPDNSFRGLAPAIIKDFKHAQEAVLAGNPSDITISETLQSLAPIAETTFDVNEADGLFESVADDPDLFATEESNADAGTDDFGADLFDDLNNADGVDETANFDDLRVDEPFDLDAELFSESGTQNADSGSEVEDISFEFEESSSDDSEDGLEDIDSFLQLGTTSEPEVESGNAETGLDAFDLDNPMEDSPSTHAGPEVGAAELNSLADLFENESAELDMDWQEEVIPEASDLLNDGLELEESSDFSDLLFSEDRSPNSQEQEDVSDLLNITSQNAHEVTTTASNGDLDEFFGMGSAEQDSDSILEDPQDANDAISEQGTSELDNLGAFFSQDDDELDLSEPDPVSAEQVEFEDSNTQFLPEQDALWDEEGGATTDEEADVESAGAIDEEFEGINFELGEELEESSEDDLSDENSSLDLEGLSVDDDSSDNLLFDEQTSDGYSSKENSTSSPEVSDLELELDLEFASDDSGQPGSDTLADDLGLSDDLDLDLGEIELSEPEESELEAPELEESESSADLSIDDLSLETEDFDSAFATDTDADTDLDFDFDFDAMETGAVGDTEDDLESDSDFEIESELESDSSKVDASIDELGLSDDLDLDLRELEPSGPEESELEAPELEESESSADLSIDDLSLETEDFDSAFATDTDADADLDFDFDFDAMETGAVGDTEDDLESDSDFEIESELESDSSEVDASIDELGLSDDLDLDLRELEPSEPEESELEAPELEELESSADLSIDDLSLETEDFDSAFATDTNADADADLDFDFDAMEMEDVGDIENDLELDSDLGSKDELDLDDELSESSSFLSESQSVDKAEVSGQVAQNESGAIDSAELELQELLGDDDSTDEAVSSSENWWLDESEDDAEPEGGDLDQLFDSGDRGTDDVLDLEGIDDDLGGTDDAMLEDHLSEQLTEDQEIIFVENSTNADADSGEHADSVSIEESFDNHSSDDIWSNLEEVSDNQIATEDSGFSDDFDDIWDSEVDLSTESEEAEPQSEDVYDLTEDSKTSLNDKESESIADFDFDAEFGDLDNAESSNDSAISSEELFEDLGSRTSESMGLDTLVGEVLRADLPEEPGTVDPLSLDEAAITLNGMLDSEEESEEFDFDSMDQAFELEDSGLQEEPTNEEPTNKEEAGEFDFDSMMGELGAGESDDSGQVTDGLDDLSAINFSGSESAIGDTDAGLDRLDLSAETDFEDLEALLDEPLDTLESEESELETDADGLASEEAADEFDDLEALLDETPISTIPEDVADIESDDDFADLEKLLEDADQKLGGSSTSKVARGTSPGVSRRPSRRASSLTDQTMRVPVKNLDNLNNLVGELVVNRNSLEQSQERLRQFLDNLLYQVQQLSDVGQRMRDLYERSLLESSLLSNRRTSQMAAQIASTATASASGLADTHATGASFDALEMDRFTGFHTLSQEMIELIVRVREAASDIDFVVDESDQITRMFRQVTTQLQEGLTRSRMVPFAQAATRLPRAVRDISIKCGKQAEMVIEGKDTLIDKMILEQLYDPMTHLVNNAITHGIETPEERQAMGKPPTGKITIRVFHQGNQTIISVSDDGAGIDPDNVKRKAIERGLILAEESAEMSDLETYDLLFHHGFSTRDKADDFAGRGVGMDVVRTSLNEIRGVVNIDSVIHQGTTFTIRLPLTLSISKALLCVSNRARVAFPMDGVEDMLDVPRERVLNDEQERPCIQWRDIMLPFQPLANLLKYNRSMGRGSVYGGNQEDDVISVVVLRSGGNYLALQVDQVLGEQEIVIKQLEAPVPKPTGIAGATVLGDGRIMPIADVLELIDLSIGRIRRESGSSLWDQEMAQAVSPPPHDSKSEPTVLIVDDSITVRELLSMTFNKVGYRVEQARDGQEAWEKLKSGLPCDLVFCDIEMPRMDGLELLSRLQKDGTLKDLPIAMLTSRGADRHRQMAVQLGAKGYFTKPYLEEALLDAAQRMLNGEVLVTA